MGSVLFQEIREFRSMAYSTSGGIWKPIYQLRDREPSHLNAYVGTQGDKTLDAMTVLDSLIRELPLSENRFEMVRKDVWSQEVNGFPDFRNRSNHIATNRRNGYDADPTATFYDLLEQVSLQDIEGFWKKNVSGRPIVWVIVGDPDKIGLENLEKFGPLTQLKPSDVIR